MKILLIDNYDSFTYNLYHYLEQFADRVDVCRNDELTLEQIEGYDKLVISPGPGLPSEAGITMDVLDSYHDKMPILGVCLGFQAIVEFYGGELSNLETVLHGKVSKCRLVSDDFLFTDVPSEFEVGHYHSWVANSNLPECLEVTSLNEHGLIMSIKHKNHLIKGVQFHPESVMTPLGITMIKNWVIL